MVGQRMRATPTQVGVQLIGGVAPPPRARETITYAIRSQHAVDVQG
ncbi:MAG: hypothetical protein AAF483_30865 [Planctomycetota bacterium]